MPATPKQNPRLIAVLFAAIVMLAAAIVLLPVRTIEINTDCPYTAEQILEAAEAEKGLNLLFLDKKQLAADIRERLPKIGGLIIHRKLPGTLVITATPSSASGVLHNGEGYWLVNNRGQCMEEFRKEMLPEGLPILNGAFRKALSAEAEEEVSDASGVNYAPEGFVLLCEALNGSPLDNRISSVTPNPAYTLPDILIDGRYLGVLGDIDSASTDSPLTQVQNKLKVAAATIEVLDKRSPKPRGILSLNEKGKAYYHEDFSIGQEETETNS
ncbi:MAG: FtsQ-type POTRA domain-containing protein [Oscillospiraceae bacterium]|jgi:hypothetical protein|nr:FtsQ-type POTRA domain-containing protein [Oscillospiraceae bacterium]